MKRALAIPADIAALLWIFKDLGPEELTYIRGHNNERWTGDEIQTAIARHEAKLARDRLAWCPQDRFLEYRRLTRVKLMPAAEARAVIEADVARGRGA